MNESVWIPDAVSLDKPSAARIYDYLLGGYHNFESDRMVAEKMVEVYPNIRLAAQANRAFLRRAVRFIASQGIGQFLDIGSGIPTAGNVHEVAQVIDPQACVVYVDIDPVAVAHSQAILQGNRRAIAIRGDLQLAEEILRHAEVRSLLAFDKPMGLLLVSVLPYVMDDERAYRAVHTLVHSLLPGSYVAIAHATAETQAPGLEDRLGEPFRSASDSKNRTREEILRFFEGCELLEPGLVYAPLWRPESPDDVLFNQPERGLTLAGVARTL
jgi:hypothetical protein